MGCLGDDDVVRDAEIEEMPQAEFSASPLGARRLYQSTDQVSESVPAVQFRFRVVQSAAGDSRAKLAGGDLTCD
jgi:hypothetical protein